MKKLLLILSLCCMFSIAGVYAQWGTGGGGWKKGDKQRTLEEHKNKPKNEDSYGRKYSEHKFGDEIKKKK